MEIFICPHNPQIEVAHHREGFKTSLISADQRFNNTENKIQNYNLKLS